MPLIVDVFDVVMFDVDKVETVIVFAVTVPSVDKSPVILFMTNLQTDGPTPRHELIAK